MVPFNLEKKIIILILVEHLKKNIDMMSADMSENSVDIQTVSQSVTSTQHDA